MLRCIYCGSCEDACPTEAIVLEHNYELSFYDRASAIYTKEMLIVDVPVNGNATPQQVEPGAFDRAIPDMEDPQ
jgi:NADH-quinone oxidoreductase subunit I